MLLWKYRQLHRECHRQDLDRERGRSKAGLRPPEFFHFQFMPVAGLYTTRRRTWLLGDSQAAATVARCGMPPIRRAGGLPAVEVTRSDLSVLQLRAEAGRTADAKQARRILAIALVLDGHSRLLAARACGMDRRTPRDWVPAATRMAWPGSRTGPGLAASSQHRGHEQTAWLKSAQASTLAPLPC